MSSKINHNPPEIQRCDVSHLTASIAESVEGGHKYIYYSDNKQWMNDDTIKSTKNRMSIKRINEEAQKIMKRENSVTELQNLNKRLTIIKENFESKFNSKNIFSRITSRIKLFFAGDPINSLAKTIGEVEKKIEEQKKSRINIYTMNVNTIDKSLKTLENQEKELSDLDKLSDFEKNHLKVFQGKENYDQDYKDGYLDIRSYSGSDHTLKKYSNDFKLKLRQLTNKVNEIKKRIDSAKSATVQEKNPSTAQEAKQEVLANDAQKVQADDTQESEKKGDPAYQNNSLQTPENQLANSPLEVSHPKDDKSNMIQQNKKQIPPGKIQENADVQKTKNTTLSEKESTLTPPPSNETVELKQSVITESLVRKKTKLNKKNSPQDLEKVNEAIENLEKLIKLECKEENSITKKEKFDAIEKELVELMKKVKKNEEIFRKLKDLKFSAQISFGYRTKQGTRKEEIDLE